MKTSGATNLNQRKYIDTTNAQWIRRGLFSLKSNRKSQTLLTKMKTINVKATTTNVAQLA